MVQGLSKIFAKSIGVILIELSFILFVLQWYPTLYLIKLELDSHDNNFQTFYFKF